MKINGPRLRAAVATLVKSSNPKGKVSAVVNVQMCCADGFLHMRTFNFDQRCVARIECEGDLAPVAVSARGLHDLLKETGGADYTVDLKSDEHGDKLCFSGGGNTFTIPAQGFENLGVFDTGGAILRLEFEPSDVARWFGRLAHAMPKEEAHYYLNGAFYHVSEGKLLAVATNRHLLARVDCPVPYEAPAGMSGIIPRGAVEQMLKMPKGVLTMTFYGKHFSFAQGDCVTTTQLVDGTFPDYMRVIPKAPPFTLTVNVKTALAALKPLCSVKTKSRGVKLEKMGEGKWRMSTTCLATGDREAEFEARCAGSSFRDGFEVGCNRDYLSDTLKQCHATNADLRFADTQDRFVWRGDAAPAPGQPDSLAGLTIEDDGALFLIMPYRL